MWTNFKGNKGSSFFIIQLVVPVEASSGFAEGFKAESHNALGNVEANRATEGVSTGGKRKAILLMRTMNGPCTWKLREG